MHRSSLLDCDDAYASKLPWQLDSRRSEACAFLLTNVGFFIVPSPMMRTSDPTHTVPTSDRKQLTPN